MRRATLILVAFLVLLCFGLVLYGIHHGDASYVAENAKAFCFS